MKTVNQTIFAALLAALFTLVCIALSVAGYPTSDSIRLLLQAVGAWFGLGFLRVIGQMIVRSAAVIAQNQLIGETEISDPPPSWLRPIIEWAVTGAEAGGAAVEAITGLLPIINQIIIMLTVCLAGFLLVDFASSLDPARAIEQMLGVGGSLVGLWLIYYVASVLQDLFNLGGALGEIVPTEPPRLPPL